MTINHPSYQPSTTIRATGDSDDWRVTRKTGDERFRLYGHFATLGDVAAMIRNAHSACASRWKVNGVEVAGTANAWDIAETLRLSCGYAKALSL